MNNVSLPKEKLKELLDEFLQTHYNGSFSSMVCEYVHDTEMTDEEVKALLKEMQEMFF